MRLANDVYGHRMLKLVVKQVYESEIQAEEKECLNKYVLGNTLLNEEIKSHSGWVVISAVENCGQIEVLRRVRDEIDAFKVKDNIVIVKIQDFVTNRIKNLEAEL